MLATGEAFTLRSNRDGPNVSLSVLLVAERSKLGFSGTGVLAGEALEIVGVSLPGPPNLLAGVDTLTDELNESERGPASLRGRKLDPNCRDSGGAGGSPARGDSWYEDNGGEVEGVGTSWPSDERTD